MYPYLGISVHVEGFKGEANNRLKYMRHRQALVETADAAEAHGARLSFELSAEFTAAMARWGDDFASLMAARGHAIGVHADLGGTPIPLDEFTHPLAERKAAIEAQGVTVTHVSGICSASDWVEAAIGAGFESATGIVEYCIKSIPAENRPPG